MTEQLSPITPPEEVVQQWRHQWKCAPQDCMPDLQHYITTQAAQWGADQELESCCEWLRKDGYIAILPPRLRAARRPKPPSLKDQALRILAENGTTLDGRIELEPEDIPIIRRALEQLND